MFSILAVSDLHGSRKAAGYIDHYVYCVGPKLLVVAGDITNFGPAEWAREFLEGLDVPVLAVNGNCDTPEVTALLRGMDEVNLMDRCKEISGIRFAGLAHPPKRIDFEGPVDVLVTHEPPWGCNDEVVPGSNIGSGLVREMTEELKPRILISGHAHEARGICKLGETVCVNPGPAMDGRAAYVLITDEVLASLMSP